jgi:hypothetical protein
VKRSSAATRYTGDDDPTRFMARKVVIPFPEVAKRAEREERPSPPSARAAVAPAPRPSWPVRAYAKSVLAGTAVLGAIWSVFMLGILVGREAPPSALEEPSAPPSAPATGDLEPTSVASEVDSPEVERAQDVAVAPAAAAAPRPFPRAAKSHGGHGVAVSSKRVAKRPPPQSAPAPSPASSRAPAPESAAGDEDVLGAAAAADELARAQLEAVMH